MPYEAALAKAWDELRSLSKDERRSVRLLTDTYDINIKGRKVSSDSCNTPAKDFLTILILHYLVGSIKKGFFPGNEWISFKDVEGGEFYYPAYHEGAIKPILRKYGADPQGLAVAAKRLNGKSLQTGDAGLEVETFPGIFIRIIIWRGDEEFGPEATILFDRNITKIFSMEDITVFSRFIAHSL